MSEKQEYCSICNEKLKFLNTQFKKHQGKKICTSCAWKISKGKIKKEFTNSAGDTGGKCPKCGSENIQVYSESNVNGYGVGKGCCGSILFGPIGLLCGLCGQKPKSQSGRICINCGKKF